MVTRKQFLRSAAAFGLLTPLAAVPILPINDFTDAATAPSRQFRIRPTTPDLCSPAFLNYCRRARFTSAEAAYASSSRTRHPFEIYEDPMT